MRGVLPVLLLLITIPLKPHGAQFDADSSCGTPDSVTAAVCGGDDDKEEEEEDA